MIKKVLVANRGEIAVRIIRACREMGIETVAVYSEADRESVHTQLADEAICIGPAQSSESYLSMEQITGAQVSESIGYPIIIKAALGGGGKGMRVANTAEDFENSFMTAQKEAKNAFGDDTMYIEHFVRHPRHIEFQILADSQGNVIHLGERDCSIQRNHQK